MGIAPFLRGDARTPKARSRAAAYLTGLAGRSRKDLSRSARGPQIESLEPRMVLDAANLVISEFLASNNGGLRDQDGAASDWIEIYNADTTAVNLNGWFLSDNAQALDKWAFPAQTIQPGEYLIVFASSKNRVIAGSELHTNFNLSAEGEFFALSYNDPVTGLAAVHQFNPSFAAQTANVSHGFDQPFEVGTLIGPTTPVQVLVPSEANGGSTLGNTWTQPGFTPTGWTNGTNGVGWQDGTDFNGLINTNVKAAMDGQNASAFVRIPFGGVDPTSVANLQLDLNYDDGFIAYLNGTEVARNNAPASAAWNSAATAEHGGVLAQLEFPTFTSNTGWAFNSNNAAALPSITGNRLRITPAATSLGNSAFRSNPIAFDPAYYSFSTRMSIELSAPGGSSDPDGPGADGLVFVLQTDGPNRVGTAGGGLGLDGAFTQYVAIEFDTWNGGSFDPDTALASHIGINSSAAGGNVARVGVPRFNDGGIRNVWIDYDGRTDTMNVYFTTSATKPATPTLTTQIDLASIFGGLPQLYAGFTAGTGSAFNIHDVVSWELTSGAGNTGTVAETFDLTQHAHLLSPVSNVLSIHGMNRSAADDDPNSLSDRDFLVRPQLHVTTVSPINLSVPRYFDPPSPGLPNGIGTNAPSRPVTFSRVGGTFVNSFQLTLSAAPGAEIRYTTNKTTPTATSTLYTGPITITNSTVIRAISIEPGSSPSKPETRNYIALDTSVAAFESNLPIIVIDSFGAVSLSDRDMSYVGAAIIETGADGIARITDAAQYAGRGGLRFRGQTSQGFPKPHYAYETWNEDQCVSRYGVAKGCALSVPLLGMPAENDWVLNNPYSEKPLMQNQLAYHWSSETGMYASRTRFVEVFSNLNGDPKIRYSLTAANAGNVTLNDYLGVYLFMEKIKIDSERVDIDELETTDNTAPNITGGYIYKRDKVGYGDVPWSSSRGIDYRLHDPDDGAVTPEQKTWLRNWINEMESVIYGANFTDPVNGYAKYIDVDSWVNHWIMVEMTKNIDGFRLSTYYTKERDIVDPVTNEVIEYGKVTMGPVWDYNLSLGNADYLQGWMPNTWYHSQSATLNATTGLTEGEYIYFRRLFQDPNFKQKVIDRWQELRETVFSDANILKDVNDNIALLTNGNPNPVATDNPALWTDPITRNFSRWRIIGTDQWPNWFFGSTWMADVTWMRDTFLMPRLAWIDSQFLAKPLANQDGGLVPEGFQVSLEGPAGSQVYYTLDGSDPRTGGSVIPGTGATTILPSNAPLKYIVPTNNDLALTWTQRTFNDSAWTSGTSGIGYERASGYESLIQTDLNAQMTGSHRGVYVRMNFNVDNPAAVNRLNLHFKYDDGFVAYLNGTEVARRNFTGTPTWDAGATQIHDDAQAVVFEDIDISSFRNLLVAGNNVLAFAGYNDLTTSSDLLFLPEIRINGTPDTIVPAGVSPNAILYTGPITINSNTRVTARAFRSATSDFSGPFEGTFITQSVPFVVTEINYNPAAPTQAEIDAGFVDNNDFEFIELRNVGATPLNLGGMRIADGVNFTFPASTLPAGERVLVVKNTAAFALRYGLGHNIAGTYTGSLANEGEHIQVLGPIGELTMDFTFSDAWHPLTDGGGSSLVIVDDSAAPATWNLATSWRPSDYSLGSPGTGDSSIAPAPDSLRINELLLDSPSGQRIELYNSSSSTIDVSGFYLSDSAANLTKYRLPLSLPPIIAGGYLVLEGADTFGTELPLSLNGGQLILRAADAGGLITGFETREVFSAAAPGVSQGWYIKSTGRHDFTPLTTPTFGAANSAPVVGPVVINEMMYQPLVTGDEYIELKNISGAPIALQDWSFSEGVSFTFGATTLGAGEFLLVSSIDPATFRTKYSIPANVQIVGPYTGNLNNAGENVVLSRPNATGGNVRIDRVNYNSDDQWPIRPQGVGSSLSRIASNLYGNDVASWGADAPGGSPGQENSIFDDTPPTVPSNVVATVTPGSQVVVTWTPSFDPQSSVAHYNVYRNNTLHATVTDPVFVDAITDPSVTYVYEVSAVNPSLEESARSAQASARVLVLNSASSVSPTSVRVRFNSVVTAASAQNLSNYVIPGLNVTGAVLEAGATSVLLTTSAQTNGHRYRVVVNGVLSNAGVLIQPNGTGLFTTGSQPGLAAEYFNDPATVATPNLDSLLPGNRVATRVDPNIEFNWGAVSPIPGTVNADWFSTRWTGKLQSMTAGEYRVSIQASDGIRVWITPEGQSRGEPFIDRWINSTFNTLTASIVLSADTTYDFVAEFYETTGSASAFIRWILPGQTTPAPIPASQFTHVTLETVAPQISDVLVASSQWTPAFLSHLQAQGLGNGGYKVPLGASTSVLPWSNLNQIKVRFDSDVLVGSGDLTIGGVNVANYGINEFDYDYATLTATWTLSQPIAFDRTTISLASSVTDLSFNAISGQRTAGVNVAAGDINGDGTVSSADRIGQLARQFTTIGHANYLATADLTGDGAVNAADLVMLQQRFGSTLPAPSAAASAVLVHRAIVANAEGSTEAQPIRVARRVPVAQRQVAAVDRAIGERSEAPAETSNTLSAIRARRVSRAAVDAALSDGAL